MSPFASFFPIPPWKDPFLGGGTVVVEALRAGRLGIGSDISPLALFVARGRTWTASDTELEELCEVRRVFSFMSSVVYFHVSRSALRGSSPPQGNKTLWSLIFFSRRALTRPPAPRLLPVHEGLTICLRSCSNTAWRLPKPSDIRQGLGSVPIRDRQVSRCQRSQRREVGGRAKGWAVVYIRGGGAESCNGATSSEQQEYCGSSLFPFGRFSVVSFYFGGYCFATS